MQEGTLRYLRAGTPSAHCHHRPRCERNARLVTRRPCKDLTNLPCKQSRRAKRHAREGSPALAHHQLPPPPPSPPHSPEINTNAQLPLISLIPFPHTRGHPLLLPRAQPTLPPGPSTPRRTPAPTPLYHPIPPPRRSHIRRKRAYNLPMLWERLAGRIRDGGSSDESCMVVVGLRSAG